MLSHQFSSSHWMVNETKGICSVAFLALLSITLFPGSLCRADWTYNYTDDFSTQKAEKDSYDHSVFWPELAFPPAEPYLFYARSMGNPAPGLMFMDFQNRRAHLSYCFPIAGAQDRMMKGAVEFDLKFPINTSGACFSYSISPDAIHWTLPTALSAGRHSIPVGSDQGTCYICFQGAKALLDNLAVTLRSPSATICVPKDYPTIQAAIDAAVAGDIIEVAPNVYSGRGNVNLELRGKAITVRSADGPGKTIIDCNPYSTDSSGIRVGIRGFYIHENEGPDTIIKGFTIRNGLISGSEIPAVIPNDPMLPIGGGIFCHSAGPSIIDCVIENCGTEMGGGIGGVNASASISRCIIRNCKGGGFGPCESGGRGAGLAVVQKSDCKITEMEIVSNRGYYNARGGGIYIEHSDVNVRCCTLMRNGAVGNINGGGVYIGSQSTAILHHCVIVGNSAQRGGGVLCEKEIGSDCYVRMINCTVADNHLQYPMPIFNGGGVETADDVDIQIRNSIIWNNEGQQLLLVSPPIKTPVLYCDVERGYSGPGNIDSDPYFTPVAAVLKDYHLQSPYGRYNPALGQWVFDPLYSPCIDAGDPADSIGQEPVPNGGRINMGAYGGTRQASKSRVAGGCVADLNQDGKVDLDDFAIFSGYWLWKQP